MAAHTANGHGSQGSSYPFLDLSFDGSNAEASVVNLVCHIRTKWRDTPEQLEVVKFTEGITNTLLKVARKAPGATQDEIDRDSVLMRAYGNNTDILIDRDREALSHGLLAARGMAPPLLARFQNGLLYGFIPGKPCTAEDFSREPVWRGIARKLGEWHARVPVSAIASEALPQNNDSNATERLNGTSASNGVHKIVETSTEVSGRKPTPNIWSVMQKWINALSGQTDKEKARKQMLQHELDRTFKELDNGDGIGTHGFVFGHCDLLCANVIQLGGCNTPQGSELQPVTFIDYEYAAPAPAAFDVSNHFAEWAGYDCDYSKVPTKSVRKAFVQEYIASYSKFSGNPVSEVTAQALYDEIDRFRGVPGLYWGIWALIQAKISHIDFDYAVYAESRLGEYFAWRAEADGSRNHNGQTVPLRERRWAED